ncbi:hypothetical protein BC834DRAFT_971015 [Gloeopeniophorella convolvens]|nr:hypothetical protein BC834DRAFT_971015 [Gloeopeniophorella convolvens]
MFSLSKIATFAILALGTLTSAAPADERSVKARAAQDQTSTVVSILSELSSTITPLAAQFSSLSPSSASTEQVSSIVSSIASEVSAATAKIQALPGGTSTSSATLQPLSAVVNNALKPAAPFANSAIFVPFFSPLDVTISLLLNTVTHLVDELLVIVDLTLNSLLGDVSFLLSGLGLGGILGILGL